MTQDHTAPGSAGSRTEPLTLQLAYRPPFDWPGMVGFLGGRALRNIEAVQQKAYLRTVRLGDHQGWIRVRDVPERHALLVDLSGSLTPALPALRSRLGNLFDVHTRPEVVGAHLSKSDLLASAVRRNPGLRVPGAFDGFEMAIRAILGQQVTVKAATTLGGRFAEAFGEPFHTPHPGLRHLSPTPERVAQAEVGEIASLGIIAARARCILALSVEVASGRLRLEAGADPEITSRQLLALPGIGPWTAQYIAMRALRWPDAFPKEDVALRKRLGGVSAATADALSQEWRPWRSYATLHLWQSPAIEGNAEG